MEYTLTVDFAVEFPPDSAADIEAIKDELNAAIIAVIEKYNGLALGILSITEAEDGDED